MWNRQKRVYDGVLVSVIVLLVSVFSVATLTLFPAVTAETLIIRAFGATAFVLLTFVLLIGPLARLTPRALPLLYNRRHLGVATFLVALTHGLFALIQFHLLGDVNPVASVLSHFPDSSGGLDVPFQLLGFVALLILFAMAATSHDFWLANLSAPVWKALHMLVYVAYALVVGHIVFGAMQDQGSAPLGIIVSATAGSVIIAHCLAGWRERDKDIDQQGEWVSVCDVDDIEENHAEVATIGAERVAVFRYRNTLSAVSAVCQHQNGPLGEGCIIDGLITCPWHGYQYDPATGASPAPFEERIPTFNLRLDGSAVQVQATPNAPGQYVEPVRII
ncbi:MAG: Rieske 2Fe-2S domain-containing protein [Pseudomonadota bacterium]